MLCCPCFPIGKPKKVHPVPVQEAAIPRPQRVRPIFKRLRRLFKKKEKKSVEPAPPQTVTRMLEEPIKDEAPSPECEPEVPATTITSNAPQDLTKEEEEEERKGEESPVWAERVRGPRHGTPQSLKEEDVMMEDKEGGPSSRAISCSHSPVMETSSRATSCSNSPVTETSSRVTSSSHAPVTETSSRVTRSSHAPVTETSSRVTRSSHAPVTETSSRITSSSHAPVTETSSRVTRSSHAPVTETSSRVTRSSHAPVTETSSRVTRSSHAPVTETSSRVTRSSHAPVTETSSRVTSSSHAPVTETSSRVTRSSHAPVTETSSRVTSSSHAPVTETSSRVTRSSHAPVTVTLSRVTRSSHAPVTVTSSRVTRSSHAPVTVTLSRVTRSSHAPVTVTSSRVTRSSHAPVTVTSSRITSSSHAPVTETSSRVTRSSHAPVTETSSRVTRSSHAPVTETSSRVTRSSHAPVTETSSRVTRSSHAPVMVTLSGVTRSSHAPVTVTSSRVTRSSHAPVTVTSSRVTRSSHAPVTVTSSRVTRSSHAPVTVTSSRATRSSHAPVTVTSSRVTRSSHAPVMVTSSRVTRSSHAPVTVTSSRATRSSNAPVTVTLSGVTSGSSLDRLAVQVMGHSGDRASRGRSRSPCSALTTPRSPKALLHQYLQLESRGLPNLGQTCYVNAVLQCLIHLQALCSQLLLQEAVWRVKPEALLISTFVGLLRLRGSTDMDVKAAVLFEFKENIAQHNQEFEGNYQNDAHEFLSECLLRLSAISQELAMGDVAYQCPVDTLLSFQLRYIRTCQSCGVESSRDELNTMFSLDLVEHGSVKESLQLYFAETAVEFRCDCCNGRGSTLRCHFHTLPQVLILHLKRFCPLTLTKQHQAVTLDPSLNLRARGERTEEAIRIPSPPTRAVSSVGGETGTETTETGSQYKLISILSHIGSDATSGHYIADCQEQPGQWVLYDDHDVSLTSEKAVLKDRERTAYILFYIQKCGRSPRFPPLLPSAPPHPHRHRSAPLRHGRPLHKDQNHITPTSICPINQCPPNLKSSQASGCWIVTVMSP
ncbi:flocculation protein FLO11-like isoform X2 [Alosa sapidissima]|uniref:flocculation protein FLO11-like isoform X2 n=1 Tax=Alosa sapidissima TaxID=34773 RepID=UPI001C090E29|nr:flocculation protein FLO11-like isoform X2 [Alosa sapidissima]